MKVQQLLELFYFLSKSIHSTFCCTTYNDFRCKISSKEWKNWIKLISDVLHLNWTNFTNFLLALSKFSRYETLHCKIMINKTKLQEHRYQWGKFTSSRDFKCISRSTSKPNWTGIMSTVNNRRNDFIIHQWPASIRFSPHRIYTERSSSSSNGTTSLLQYYSESTYSGK